MTRKRVKAAATGAPATTVRWNGKEHQVNVLTAKGMDGLEAAFAQYRSTRSRNAVYGYLTEVYRFGMNFEASKDCVKVGKRMITKKGLARHKPFGRFSLLVRATSDVDEKTRWKWVRCLVFAQMEEREPSEMRSFILDEHHGINSCVAAYCEKWGE